MEYDIKDARLSCRLTPKTANTALGMVEYVEVGDGPVVVSLHGAMGGYDQSLLLAQTIGDTGYRYLAVSRPGYLGTPISSGKSPEQQGDLIAALLDHLGIPGTGIMAVSGGGPSALQFGLRYPSRCAGLVLVSTCAERNVPAVPLSFKIMTLLARQSWFAKRMRKKAEKDLKAVAGRSIQDPEILARTMADTETWPLFSTLLLSTFDQMGRRIGGTQNDIRISRSAIYPLEDLAVPVLVVHGTEDQQVPFEVHARRYQALVRNAEILAVDGGRHVAIFSHRGIVKPRVAEFMARHFTA